jgi:hypothetical protein
MAGRARKDSGDREIARDLVIGKPKLRTTKDTKEHRGNLVIGKAKFTADKRGSGKL